MPVGTHGVVRGLSADDVRAHRRADHPRQHVPPAPSPRRRQWSRTWAGSHRFTTWPRPMLTDSGGFQVFSLEGLRRSPSTASSSRAHIDGTYRTSRPSGRWRSSGPWAPTSRWRSTTWCPGSPRTSRARGAWSGRCGGWMRCQQATATADSWTELTADGPPHRSRPCGPSSRAAPTTTSGCGRSRARSSAGPWTGIAIGGLSVGEPKPVMHRVLEALGARPARGTSPVILWGSDFPRICSRGSRAAWTCSTASPPRGTAAMAPRGCRRAG